MWFAQSSSGGGGVIGDAASLISTRVMSQAWHPRGTGDWEIHGLGTVLDCTSSHRLCPAIQSVCAYSGHLCEYRSNMPRSEVVLTQSIIGRDRLPRPSRGARAYYHRARIISDKTRDTTDVLPVQTRNNLLSSRDTEGRKTPWISGFMPEFSRSLERTLRRTPGVNTASELSTNLLAKAFLH